jgi:hypothetical protein
MEDRELRRVQVLAALAAVLVVSSCVNNGDDPARMRREFKEHPQALQTAIKRCVNEIKYWNIEAKTRAAIYLRTNKEDLPVVLCRRVLTALATDKITDADLMTLRRDKRATPRMITALRNG